MHTHVHTQIHEDTQRIDTDLYFSEWTRRYGNSLGRPGVDAHVKHERCTAVVHLQFLINEGALVSATADDILHLWNFRQKIPQVVQRLQFQRDRSVINVRQALLLYALLFSITCFEFCFVINDIYKILVSMRFIFELNSGKDWKKEKDIMETHIWHFRFHFRFTIFLAVRFFIMDQEIKKPIIPTKFTARVIRSQNGYNLRN